MTDLLTLDGFGLRPQGMTLSFSLPPGRALAVVGPAASGKTRFLRVLAGRERPGQGSVDSAALVFAEPVVANRRVTPQSLARKFAGNGRTQEAASALAATGLWEVRNEPLTSLSGTQLELCGLLAPLASPAPLMLVDGLCDGLDAWAWERLWVGLRDRLTRGAGLVVALNRLELLPVFDWVVAFRGQEVRFAGNLDDLRREGGEVEFEVETKNQLGVRALVAPFHIRIEEVEHGLRMYAAEGQAVAARLLLEGYGDVRSVVVRKPTLEECLRRRLGR